MKCDVGRPATSAALAFTVILALLGGIASAQRPWSALDNADRFTQVLTKSGFTFQEGVLEYFDCVKLACEGKLPDALGNNPWPNVYLTLRMPQPAGVPTLPIPQAWQLREDEAMVIIGQTPPPAAYYSYQTFLGFLPGDSSYIRTAVGDTINIATINTIGSTRAKSPIVYIITAHKTTEEIVRQVAREAGYPDSIINVETISPILGPLGHGPSGSIYLFGHRVAVPESEDAMREYAQHPPYRAFRATPKEPLAPNPEPIPVLRVKGTGHTEMELYPALKRLREAILAQEAPGYSVIEMLSRIWQTNLPPGYRTQFVEKPWVQLQRNFDSWAATRDTNYIQTYPYFRLREGVDEHVIVYGVNHQKTGKATYSAFALYAEPGTPSKTGREFGLGTVLHTKFADSAKRYLPNDPQADMLYAYKVARHCNGEAYCFEANVDFKDIFGQPYPCNPPVILDNTDLYIVFRGYMEPATKVGTDDNELLWDRGIYFTAP